MPSLLLKQNSPLVQTNEDLERITKLAKSFSDPDRSLLGFFNAKNEFENKWDLSRYLTEESMYADMQRLNEKVTDNQSRLNTLNGKDVNAIKYIQDFGVKAYEDYLNQELQTLPEGSNNLLSLDAIRGEMQKDYGLDVDKLNALFETADWKESLFGIGGEIWGRINPVRFTSDLFALLASHATATATGATIGSAVPLVGTATGAVAGFVGSVALDAIALGANDMALNVAIVNHRRRELGLPEIDVVESAEEVALGSAIAGGTLRLAKPVAKAVLKQSEKLTSKLKGKPVAEQTVDERAMGQMADAMSWRNKDHPTKSDSDMVNEILKDISSGDFSSSTKPKTTGQKQTIMDVASELNRLKAEEKAKFDYDQKIKLSTMQDDLFGVQGEKSPNLSKYPTPSSFIDSTIDHLNSYDNLENQFFIQHRKVLSGILDENKTLNFNEFTRFAYGETGFTNDKEYGKLLKAMNSSNESFIKDWASPRGLEIGYLENRIPQAWDRLKVLKQSAEKFAKDWGDVLNWEKTAEARIKNLEYNASKKLKKFKEGSPNYLKFKSSYETAVKKIQTEMSTTEGRVLYLKKLRQTLASDGVSKINVLEPKGRMSSSLSKRRTLIFKDADSFLETNKTYGRFQEIQGSLYADAKRKARIQAQFEILGKDPNLFFGKVQNVLKLMGADDLGLLGKPKLELVQNMLNYINGSNSIYFRSTLENIAKTTSNLKISSFLSGISRTATIGDFITATFRGTKTGIGMLSTARSYISSLTTLGLKERELDLLRITSEYARFTGRELSGEANWSDKLAKASAKFSLIEGITTRGRRSYSTLFLGHLSGLIEDLAKNGESNLSKPYRAFYKNLVDSHKISVTDLNNLRDHSTLVPFGSKGAKILDYSGLYNKETYSSWKKIAVAHDSEVNMAISKTRLSYRAFGGDNALVNGFMFLMRMPLQISIDHSIKPLLRGEYGYVSAFAVSSMLGGALNNTLRLLIEGKSVDPTTNDFWLEAFKYGELGGFLGLDPEQSGAILGAYGADYKFLQEVGKQILGLGSDSNATNRSRLTKKGIDLLKTYTPFHTHPLFKSLMDRYIFDQLQLTLDPKARELWAGQELKMRERGQEWLFRGIR